MRIMCNFLIINTVITYFNIECEGNGCSKACHCNGSPCDPYTGACKCPPNKKGHTCEHGNCLCNKRFLHLRHCSQLHTFNLLLLSYYYS